eukprot:IDg12249t1
MKRKRVGTLTRSGSGSNFERHRQENSTREGASHGAPHCKTPVGMIRNRSGESIDMPSPKRQNKPRMKSPSDGSSGQGATKTASGVLRRKTDSAAPVILD